MTPDQFDHIFPAIAQNNRPEGPISHCVESPPGIGKSELSRAQPPRMTALTGRPWGYAEMFLATQTPNLVQGFMIPKEDARGRILSRYSMPIWYQTRDPRTNQLDGKLVTDFDQGVLVIEEWGQGEGEVKRAVADLILNKRMGSWALPPGWIVLVLTNRAVDRSGVTKEFDFVINRWIKIGLSADVKSWVGWADRNNINPIFKTFAVQNPQIVFTDSVPEKQGAWCTPRSLVRTGSDLECLADKDGNLPTDPVAVELMHGGIGAAASSQLMAMIKLGQTMPAYHDILANPKTCKVPSGPDAQMLICYQLAAVVTDKEIAPVIDYIERLSKEFALTFTKAAVARDTSLINTRRMGDWCSNNATLLAAIQSVKAAGAGFKR